MRTRAVFTARYTVLTAAAAGAVVALLATAVVVAAGPAGAAGPAQRLLPDLRQAPVGCAPGSARDDQRCTAWDVCPVADPADPHARCVTDGPIRSVRLRFTSSEENVGDGPLLLFGHRDSTAIPTMAVRQAFQAARDAPLPESFAAAPQPLPASMYYEPATMHKHWHLLGFDRFQLLDASGKVVVTDRKTGFCLGDRYDLPDTRRLPGAADAGDGTPQGDLAEMLQRNNCKMHDPGALDVTEGISVGQGDNYDYTVDYQWLDVTTVPSGTYMLVNTVNPDRSIIEKDYANNASSIAVTLRWPGGGAAPHTITAPPTVTLLRSCPGSDRCAG